MPGRVTWLPTRRRGREKGNGEAHRAGDGPPAAHTAPSDGSPIGANTPTRRRWCTSPTAVRNIQGAVTRGVRRGRDQPKRPPPALTLTMIMPRSALRAATGRKLPQNTHLTFPTKIEDAQVCGGAPGRIRTCDRRIRSRLIRVPCHSSRYLTRSISTASSETPTNYSAGLCQRPSERARAAEQTPSKHGDRYAAPWGGWSWRQGDEEAATAFDMPCGPEDDVSFDAISTGGIDPAVSLPR
jgi:hypothetical protein